MTPLPHRTTGDRVYSVKLLKRVWLSENTFEVEFSRPQRFEFAAGQWIRLIWRDLQRDYSLVSTPGDSAVSLCVRKIKAGPMSSLLATAEMGSPFQLSGPHGYFTFRNSPRAAIFVATGTGVAPFVSMMRSGAEVFKLLHGVKCVDDLYYNSLFQKLGPNYIPCLSGSAQRLPPCGNIFQGRVTQWIERNLYSGKYDFYLSGRSEMVRDVTWLADEKFAGSFVYSEVFF